MKKINRRITALLLALIMLSMSAYAEGTGEKESETLVINGVEYDISDMSPEEIDALMQTNVSTGDYVQSNEALNAKHNPSYTIDKFIQNGWSGEYAGEKKQVSATGETLSKYESALRLISALEIIPEQDGKYNAGGEFEPEDFAAAALKISPFTENPSAEVECGESVTAENLTEYFISALGYDVTDARKQAEAKGEMLRYIESSSKSLSREAAAQIIYNAMIIPQIVATSYTPSQAYYAANASESILERMEIKGVTGWINANSSMNIYAGEPTEGIEKIEIGRAVFEITDMAYAEYLGHYVDAFVYSSPVRDIPVVISMTDNNRYSDSIVTVKNRELAEITSSQAVFRRSDYSKKETLKLKGSTRVCYNRCYEGILEGLVETLKICDELTFIDTDFDKTYDVIIALKAQHHLISSVGRDGLSLDNNTAVYNFDKFEEDEITIILDGSETTLNNLKSNYVVSIIENPRRKAVLVDASSKSDEGYLTSMTEDMVELDSTDEYYYISDSALAEVKLGRYYKMYFNVFGEIAFAAELGMGNFSNGRSYAYLTRTGTTRALGKRGQFRMWVLGKSDGTWITMDGAEKMTLINGAELPKNVAEGAEPPAYKLSSAEVAEHPDIKDKPQLIAFETNDEGQLKTIITCQDSTSTGYINEDVFQLNKKYTSNFRLYHNGFFGGEWVYNSDTVAIAIPPDRDDEESYTYITSRLRDSTWTQQTEIYDANVDRTLNLVLRYDSSTSFSISSSPTYLLVDEVRYVNIDGETMIKLTSPGGTEYVTDNYDEDIGIDSFVPTQAAKYDVAKLSQVKEGDLLAIGVSSAGKIKGFALVARLSEINDEENFFSYSATGESVPSASLAGVARYAKVVLNTNAATSMVINCVGDGTNPLNDTVVYRKVASAAWEYNISEGTFTKIKCSDIMKDDKIVYTSDLWYLNPLVIRIKE